MATTSGGFAFTPIRGLAALIAERRASPVEVAEYFLARLETLGPDYNAVAALAPERALATARRAESEIASGRRTMAAATSASCAASPGARKTFWRPPAESPRLGARRRSPANGSTTTPPS